MIGGIARPGVSNIVRDKSGFILGQRTKTRRRPQRGFNPINQISFRMADFAGVREMYRRLQHEPVTEISPVSHGNALSVYFRDPEGNRLELFIDTPWYVKQPLRVPMDMKLSDRELWAWAEAEARKQPGFKPVEEWRSALSRQMEQR